jgi:signal transduction histidine kinase
MAETFIMRHRAALLYLAFYLVWVAVAGRAAIILFDSVHPQRWLALGLLLAFLALTVSKHWLTGHYPWLYHSYLLVQAGLIFTLLLLPPYLDFFAILYLPLSGEAMLFFPHRTGLWWSGAFNFILAAGLTYGYGWPGSLPYIFIYAAGTIFIGSYAAITAEAEAARQRSQALLAELQKAHRQLQHYAAQAEELAVTRERHHLARELHDSVTQTIFSLTLTAKAARILLEQDPTQVGLQLDRLQELAESALTEMRSLIFQLRPSTIEKEGLVPALRQHVASLQSRTGLVVELDIEEDGQLPAEQEFKLFRIIQEALNNVVKHAQANRAVVRLRFGAESVSLLVEDDGQGFEPAAVGLGRETIGLASMRERVDLLGGRFSIESRPGQGTRIRVDIVHEQGERANG